MRHLNFSTRFICTYLIIEGLIIVIVKQYLGVGVMIWCTTNRVRAAELRWRLNVCLAQQLHGFTLQVPIPSLYIIIVILVSTSSSSIFQI